MTWRTGTKNPHTLYLDEGDVSLPQGFIMNPGAARAIVEAMNRSEGEARPVRACHYRGDKPECPYCHQPKPTSDPPKETDE